MKNLERPTSQLIEKCIEKFENNDRYRIADQAIIKLFKAFPKNIKIEDILLKISVLNDLYSTNIFGTYRIAEHIKHLNVDEKLITGNPDIVNKIATGHGIKTLKNQKEINFYSFATKYCNWHNQQKFAIYDSFVDRILMAYKMQDNFFSFVQNDMKDFRKFKNIISEFAKHYELEKHSLKEIDKFLWVYGKEKFPTSYKK